MGSLPKPTHLEIRIDEWQAAQSKPDSVDVVVRWRGVKEDSVFADLLASLPPREELTPIRLIDGRTELAFANWKRHRFGKGPPIFEAARSDYEAWAGGPADSLATARKNLMDMIRRYVPDFDSYVDKEQVDFIVRTQEKLNAIHDSVEAMIAHLEYATPKRKALPPLRYPLDNVRAAVFCDVIGSRDAGDLLQVPLSPGDECKYENQTARKMAKSGRELLCSYFGEAEWKIKVERMREYRRWWEKFESLEDSKDQIYALLAKAHGTSREFERLRGENDGFDKKLNEWIAVIESRLKIEAMQDLNQYNDDFVWPGTVESERRGLRDEQARIEETDIRFAKAYSVFDAPPGEKP
jgi:hypothetical protein